MSTDPLKAQIERDFALLLDVLREMRVVGARTIEAYDGKRHSREEHNFIFFAARATECLGANEHRNLPHAPHEVAVVYDLIYSMGSEALHAGVRGITRGATISGTSLVVNHDRRPPRSAAGFLLLLYATHLYSKIIGNVNSELALGIEADLLRLEGGHRKIWSPPTATIDGADR